MANELVELKQEELDDLRGGARTMVDMARKLAAEIVDAVTLDKAATFMLEAKKRMKSVIERLKEPKATARAAYQNWVNLEKELIEPYERIETEIIKPAMARFSMEQERKRRIEEEKLRAEARKREEDARLAEAAELEKQGQRELADAVIAAPVQVAPVVLPKVEQPKGISYRTVWRYRIVDAAKIPREYLCVDEPKLGGVVRSLKDAANIPGVEIYSEQVVAGRV